MNNIKIETKNLKVTLSGKDIIKDINIEIPKNKFVGIIGPNGSGKSTMLKSIYRVLKPSGGSIYLDGKNLKDTSIKESARKLAVLSQASQMSFDFTVFDMVLMGRSPYKKPLESDTLKDIELANEALKKVGMYEYKDRIYTSLSGGEQQRILLARALTQNTDCYILDEPTNHLDIKYQLEILDIVKNLKVTSIVALHDLNLACMYCDYIYVMDKGNIVASGKPKELITEKLIKDIYGVESKVEYNELDDRIYIFYKTSKK